MSEPRTEFTENEINAYIERKTRGFLNNPNGEAGALVQLVRTMDPVRAEKMVTDVVRSSQTRPDVIRKAKMELGLRDIALWAADFPGMLDGMPANARSELAAMQKEANEEKEYVKLYEQREQKNEEGRAVRKDPILGMGYSAQTKARDSEGITGHNFTRPKTEYTEAEYMAGLPDYTNGLKVSPAERLMAGEGTVAQALDISPRNVDRILVGMKLAADALDKAIADKREPTDLELRNWDYHQQLAVHLSVQHGVGIQHGDHFHIRGLTHNLAGGQRLIEGELAYVWDFTGIDA